MKSSLRKSLIGSFGAALLALATMPASAIMLNLQPSLQTATPGDNISLDLVITGLNAGGPDSLGDFDIDIEFDSSALSFQSYSLGTSLGDLGLFEAWDFSLGGSIGSVNLSEVSYLTPSSLDAIQSDTFTLATLDFKVDTLAVGSSTTVFFDTIWALGDSFGNPLQVQALNNATIKNGVTVPEPTTLALMTLGLIGTIVARRRRPS